MFSSRNSKFESGWRTPISKLTSFALAATALTFIAISPSHAATSVNLGSAVNFAVFAGGGITNAGNTSVTGELGNYPTISFQDLGNLNLNGGFHFGDPATIAAKNDIASAFSAASSIAATASVTTDLGNQTLLPGVYNSVSGLNLNGTLTLDAQNNPNSVFIFQSAGNLSTGASSHVNIINGGIACNVFWQVATTATLGATSDFKGTILAGSNIVAANGANVMGRLFTKTGSVALNSNTIVKPNCAIPTTTLFVIPDLKVVAYGTQKVNFTAKYERVLNNGSTVVDPSHENHGFVAPVCASTPAYSVTEVPGTYPITCVGGNGGSLYLLNTAATATLTINKVATAVKININEKIIATGSALAFTSTIVPVSGVGVCTGSTAFSLNRNPLTGVVGIYPLTASTLTTGWLVGPYILSASYLGDGNCLPATSSKQFQISVRSLFYSIQGEGKYTLMDSKAQFAFQITHLAKEAVGTSAINGQVTWLQDKQWKFKGSLTLYSISNGVSQVSDTGVLYMWSRPGKKNGKWVLATIGPAFATFKFTTTSPIVTGNSGNVDTGNGEHAHPMISAFAIGFTGQIAANVKPLPVLGALVSVNSSSGDN
jgi:hypothetical protein